MERSPRLDSETSLDSETFCSEVTSGRLCSTLLQPLLHVRGLGSNGSVGSAGSAGSFFGGKDREGFHLSKYEEQKGEGFNVTKEPP